MTARPAMGRTRSATAALRWRMSSRADGDFHVDQPRAQLEATRRRFVDLPWSMPDEVHGTTVLEVTRPGEHDGAVADALVTSVPLAVLGIWVGDCAPVAFATEGRVGAAHAGWRGLEAGVLAATVAALRAGAPTTAPVTAVLGPCIHPCCYEFGADDLARLVGRFGPTVAGHTRDGRAALDVPAAVRAALDEVGVELDDRSSCTACDADRWFSHRARAERGRQVLAVWLDAADPTGEWS